MPQFYLPLHTVKDTDTIIITFQIFFTQQISQDEAVTAVLHQWRRVRETGDVD